MQSLQALNEAALRENGGLISTAEGLRIFLQNRPEVISLRRSLVRNETTVSDLENYIRSLLGAFRPGQQFENELALAAISVALETFPGTFAKRYLTDLSNLRVKEMPLATRVATLSLSRRRAVMPGWTAREYVIRSTKQAALGPPNDTSLGPRLRELPETRSETEVDNFRFEEKAAA